MMGLIRRSFVYLDTKNFTRLYKAIVRPHLELSVDANKEEGSPYIITLENVR